MLETITFSILALAIIGTALGVILTRNAVTGVILLVGNFLVVATLYLLLGAPFIGLAQISVYAGAIMVLFLFVIMMLGAERLRGDEPRHFLRLELIILVLVFIGLVTVLLVRDLAGLPPMPQQVAGFGDPQALGMLLFTRYTLPVLAISVLLLVAAVGAVVLTKPDRPKKPRVEEKP
jgi:NADH-quinone oxidoreductase subunit J